MTLRDALVSIRSGSDRLIGTGFIIYKDGTHVYILTCKHVHDDVIASAAKRNKEPLIDGVAKYTVVSDLAVAAEKNVDLAVLQVSLSEKENQDALGDKPVAQLADLVFNSRARLSVAAFQKLEGDTNTRQNFLYEPADLPYEVSATFFLRNAQDHPIDSGNSGSPVVLRDDEQIERAIAVVSEIDAAAFRKNEDGRLIKAIRIRELSTVWSEAQWPAGFGIFQQEGVIDGSLEIEESLVGEIEDFREPMSVKLLIGASAPRSTLSLSNEVATIQDILSKLLLNTRTQSQFDIQVYELAEDGQHIQRLISNRNYGTAAEPLPTDYGDFDIVLLLLWHNLGEDDVIAQIYKQVRSEFSADNPSKQVFVLLKDSKPSLESDEGEKIEPERRNTRNFYNEFEREANHFTRFHPKHFEDAFEMHLRDYMRLAVRYHRTHQGIQRRLENKVDGDATTSAGVAQTVVPNPYKGLAQYRQSDAQYFFGRIDEVDSLVDTLANPDLGLLAVIGASGSGKSSVVRAGLLHRLTLGAIQGSRDWIIVEIKIDGDEDNQLDILAEDLLKTIPEADAGEDKVRLRDIKKWLQSVDGIHELKTVVLKNSPPGTRLLFFIDQFEEIFTLIQEESPREDFIKFIADAAKVNDVQFVLTVRSDFYHRCIEYPQLKDLFKDGTIPLIAPYRDALLGIITRPAIYHGFAFEDASLPRIILEDAGAASSTLPLVSYMLFELTQRAIEAQRNLLSMEDYQALGRVAGILEKAADDALEPFVNEPEFDERFNAVFRNLVTVNDAGTATKKPALWKNIPQTEHPIVEALVQKRLLQSDDPYAESEKSGERVVEISHEALLLNWDRLRTWINETQSDLLMLRRVESSAAEWQEAREQLKTNSRMDRLRVDRQHLWSHERLMEVHEALKNLGITVSSLPQQVQDFLRDEAERLVEELRVESVDHIRRAEIGDRLAAIGDHRPGIGLDSDGVPDFTWCKVPPGTVELRIGDAKNWKDRPIVKKTIEKPFYIAKYIVTLEQFLAFIGGFGDKLSKTYKDEDETLELWCNFEDGPSTLKTNDQGQTEPVAYVLNKWWAHKPRFEPNQLNYPAQYISWYQAMAYANWLTARYHQTKRMDVSQRIRIPTEWEWQQAASGGLTERTYPWGNTWDAGRASNQLGRNRLVAVGMYPHGQAPTGASDMSGNVYEWCLNSFDELDNINETAFAKRTTRGGAYFTFPKEEDAVKEALSVYGRLADKPDGTNARGDTIVAAIRLVCDEPPQSANVEINEVLFG